MDWTSMRSFGEYRLVSVGTLKQSQCADSVIKVPIPVLSFPLVKQRVIWLKQELFHWEILPTGKHCQPPLQFLYCKVLLTKEGAQARICKVTLLLQGCWFCGLFSLSYWNILKLISTNLFQMNVSAEANLIKYCFYRLKSLFQFSDSAQTGKFSAVIFCFNISEKKKHQQTPEK